MVARLGVVLDHFPKLASGSHVATSRTHGMQAEEAAAYVLQVEAVHPVRIYIVHLNTSQSVMIAEERQHNELVCRMQGFPRIIDAEPVVHGGTGGSERQVSHFKRQVLFTKPVEIVTMQHHVGTQVVAHL